MRKSPKKNAPIAEATFNKSKNKGDNKENSITMTPYKNDTNNLNGNQ